MVTRLPSNSDGGLTECRAMESERWHRVNVPAAKRLRATSTRSEAILWRRLRGRQFHGLKFRRQHPVGRFVLDFYCDDLQLAIEIDGSIHRDPEVAERGTAREEIIRERGLWFIRVAADATESEIETVLLEIERACGFS